MPVHNTDIAEIFNRMAVLLDIEGANQFRVRAYRNAARTIGELSQRAADMVERGEDLTSLPDIGKDLAEKIKEIVETGDLAALEKLERRTPAELSTLMKIAGLGPKRIKVLYQELGVTTLEGLKKAAEDGRIRELEGFGKKTEKQIIEEIKEKGGEKERIKLATAEELADPLVAYLRQVQGVKEVVVAGSYRRRKETVGDLDVLVTCKKGSLVMERFVNYEDVEKVVSQGKTRSTVILRTGLQVDVRVVPQVSYGAALHYFTGSQAHNIAIRKLGVKKKLKINEYGVFKGDDRIAGKSEQEVYEQVDLPYIEPELRENWGEIEAAQKDKLPSLITLKDIRGDLHAHTKETDGRHTLEEMAQAAQQQGYDYLAITDHSKRVTMVHGLNAKRLAKQIEAIDRLNEKLDGITLLKGIEVDILEDGSLDLPDDILKELDLTVCAVHYKMNLSRTKQTERIVQAMDNPYFHILAHPSGRLINERKPYELDMERVMEAAKDRGCVLELNAHPVRLDLTDRDCKMAKDMGVKVAIATDAHSTADLNLIRFGVDQARRGWLEPGDVINTESRTKLLKILQRT
jgi:DNA polymerase (family 10)